MSQGIKTYALLSQTNCREVICEGGVWPGAKRKSGFCVLPGVASAAGGARTLSGPTPRFKR